MKEHYTIDYLYKLCDFNAPFNTQESWDNSGLNLGAFSQEFEQIYLSLELTEEIALAMRPNSVILTHHPLFFKSLKNFDFTTYPSNLAKILIAKNCALIALHTNFDKSHLNEFFTQEVLGFIQSQQVGLYCTSEIEPMGFENLVQNIKQKLKLPHIRALKANELISRVFVICGSGFSEINTIAKLAPKEGLLISGDLKYHDAMIAKSLGLSLLEIPHYESEKYFVEILDSILKNAGYQAIITDCKNPITYL